MRNLQQPPVSVFSLTEKIASKKIELLEQHKPKEKTESKLLLIKSIKYKLLKPKA